ncbi:MAG: sugar kinase [Candidatus Gastranaerophilaceae bacterium]
MDTKEKFDIITIGESLIEFSTNQKLSDAECLHKYYGGDSLVVAIAAKRLNSKVGFITCLGDDAFKNYLLSSWINEGLDTNHVRIVEENNGIYLVSRQSATEKEFIYYRKRIAPAKLSIEDIDEDYIKSAKIIYASGITQSLSLQAREAVKKAFQIAKDNGIITAYDPNYSSMITTKEDAREYFDEIIPLTDILFMSSKYDTKSIFEIESLENIIKTLTDTGVQTIVIKSSPEKGYYLNNQQSTTFIPFYTENIIDTTSSGDAFNGAFLSAYANGYSAIESARIASIDAGLQAQGIGAVKSTPHYEEVYKIYKEL